MPEFPAAVQDLLARQDNVVTRAQLLEHGVSYPAVRWNAGRAWRVVLPQVFGIGREPPSARQRQIAALLWAGPRSVLSGATAARLHGITSADPLARVHVLVPAPQSSRTSGFAEIRRSLLHDPGTVVRGPLRLSSPARSAVDAARAARTEDARSAILIEAVQRGIATLDDLEEWVLRLRPRDAVPLRGPLVRGRIRRVVRARGRAARPGGDVDRALGRPGPTRCSRPRPVPGSRLLTSGSTTSPSRSWCTRGATTARPTSGTTPSTRTATSSRRASSSQA